MPRTLEYCLHLLFFKMSLCNVTENIFHVNEIITKIISLKIHGANSFKLSFQSLLFTLTTMLYK